MALINFRVVLVFLWICLQPQVGYAAKPCRILLVLWRGETQAEKSFLEHLGKIKKACGIDKISGDQDRVKLSTALREIEPNLLKYNAIYSYGTTVTGIIKTVVGGRIPVVFNMVADPVKSHLIDNPKNPKDNMTGVKNSVALDEQMAVYRKIVHFKTLLVPFNSREMNSALLIRELEELAQKQGWVLLPYRLAPESKSTEALVDDINDKKIKFDAMYFIADSYLSTAGPLIWAKIEDKNKKFPIFGATENFLNFGAAFTLAPTYADMGRRAAELMAIVIDKNSANGVPMQVYSNIPLIVNQKMIKKYKLKVPKGIATVNFIPAAN